MKKIFIALLIILFDAESNAQSGCLPQLSEDSFEIKLKKIKNYDFDQVKKDSIELLLSQCPTCDQMKQLLKELSFEEDKLDIIKKAYSKVSDPSNFKTIKTVLDFEESKNIVDQLMK